MRTTRRKVSPDSLEVIRRALSAVPSSVARLLHEACAATTVGSGLRARDSRVRKGIPFDTGTVGAICHDAKAWRFRGRGGGYFGSSDAGSVHSRSVVRRMPAARARTFFVPSLVRRGAFATSISTSLPIPPNDSRISCKCSRNRGRSISSVMDLVRRVRTPGPRTLRWMGID